MEKLRRSKTINLHLAQSTEVKGVVAIAQRNRLDGFELAGNQEYTVYPDLETCLIREARQNAREQGLPQPRRL